MNVSLTPELERLVAAKVKRGMYGSPARLFGPHFAVLPSIGGRPGRTSRGVASRRPDRQSSKPTTVS